jgi:signal transduction histidine kinase
MDKQSFDIPLHDIKPLVDVPDNSFTIFIAVVILGVILLAVVIYFLYKYFSKAKKINQRKVNFEALSNIDFSDPKKAAYEITKYGLIFENDSERVYEAYHNLNTKLTSYKYKKEVENIDEETLGYYNILLGMIDV